MHCRHSLASRARRLEPACIPTLQTYCSSSLEEPHVICWAFAVVLEAAHSVVPPPHRGGRGRFCCCWMAYILLRRSKGRVGLIPDVPGRGAIGRRARIDLAQLDWGTTHRGDVAVSADHPFSCADLVAGGASRRAAARRVATGGLCGHSSALRSSDLERRGHIHRVAG